MISIFEKLQTEGSRVATNDHEDFRRLTSGREYSRMFPKKFTRFASPCTVLKFVYLSKFFNAMFHRLSLRFASAFHRYIVRIFPFRFSVIIQSIQVVQTIISF